MFIVKYHVYSQPLSSRHTWVSSISEQDRRITFIGIRHLAVGHLVLDVPHFVVQHDEVFLGTIRAHLDPDGRQKESVLQRCILDIYIYE